MFGHKKECCCKVGHDTSNTQVSNHSAFLSPVPYPSPKELTRGYSYVWCTSNLYGYEMKRNKNPSIMHAGKCPRCGANVTKTTELDAFADSIIYELREKLGEAEHKLKEACRAVEEERSINRKLQHELKAKKCLTKSSKRSA